MSHLLHELRVISLGICIIVAGLFIAVLMLATIASGNTSAESTTSNNFFGANVSDDPNVVTRDIAGTFGVLQRHIGSLETSIGNNFQSHSLPTATSNFAKSSANIIADGFYGATMGTVHIISNTLSVIVQVPKSAASAVAPDHLLNVALRPGDSTRLPAIEAVTLTPVAAAAPAPAPAAKPANPPVTVAAAVTAAPIISQQAQWPIHGAITTLFGANDLPFERFHTGIDISDGRPAGSTPVHPYKPGRVVNVTHSYINLGNEVDIDHGGGIVSVYGHMAYTSVQVGQFVDESSVLGYEGSTGASTGTHLHFEIRLNGQPVNPELYINGRP